MNIRAHKRRSGLAQLRPHFSQPKNLKIFFRHQFLMHIHQDPQFLQKGDQKMPVKKIKSEIKSQKIGLISALKNFK